MVSISLRGIEKVYDTEKVLHDCHLDIRDHEFLVLVGPSGSGKTTLLRIISGLEEATAGELYFDTELVNDVDVGDRDVAMVFQNYGLYPHMTVAKNLGFGLRRRRVPADEVDRKVQEAARLLGIDELLGRKPKQLSGGQRQRVALGRAIVRDPAVFLLDEPLSNLDAHLRVQMRAEILRIHRAVTATAVYVTHDQVEALTMGDRIVVMHDGRIQQVGTPEELYDRPVNRFVAGFIGTPAMGFLNCTLTGEGELRGTGTRLRLPREQVATLPGPDTPVVAGIRPEHLRLASVGSSEPVERGVEGVVEVIEPLGSEQHVVVNVGGELVTARLPRSDRVRLEDKVAFDVDEHTVHVFDATTGEAYR